MGGGPHNDRVLITQSSPEPKAILEHLRARFSKIDFEYHQTSEEEGEVPVKLWKDATILVTLSAMPPKASDAPALELVQLTSAGSNQLSESPIYRDTDVTITTASGIHGPQIAEWVIMTALLQSHKYIQLYQSQKKHEWLEKGPDVKDMVGQRIGVLGYGSIGRQVGRVGKAMGMDIIAFTASPKKSPESKKDKGFIVPGTGDADGSIPSAWYSGLDKDSLHNFLKQDIDILVISVPLTDETRHMLSHAEFQVLSQKGKRPAFVTNVARGPIIDQSALVDCLKDGTLRGAALDVTDPEPLPSDSELWDMENVVITPHVSAASSSYRDRVFQLLEQQLERREKGEDLLNVVKRDRGY